MAGLIVRTRRVTLHVGEQEADYGKVATARDVVLILQTLIGDAASESVVGLWLNARQRLFGYTEIVHGSLNSAAMKPRDIFVPALLANAHSFILAHNHPSGDWSPSRADRLVTAQMRSAGEMLGVGMLDHVIVTRSGWYSFQQEEHWDP